VADGAVDADGFCSTADSVTGRTGTEEASETTGTATALDPLTELTPSDSIGTLADAGIVTVGESVASPEGICSAVVAGVSIAAMEEVTTAGASLAAGVTVSVVTDPVTPTTGAATGDVTLALGDAVILPLGASAGEVPGTAGDTLLVTVSEASEAD
jgi:hypothetical protein